MKKPSVSIIIVVSILCVLLGAILLSGYTDGTGSTEKPVELPASELLKIMDATGGPKKALEHTPAIFVITATNQSEWHITGLEVAVTNKTSGVRRCYMADPVGYIAKTGEYGVVGTINPKSVGCFFFHIGPTLSYRKRFEEGLGWQYIFEPYDWTIVRALGYKK